MAIRLIALLLLAAYNLQSTLSIKKEISKLPSLPGIYLFKDADNNVIYIGKAKSLKDWLKSYFAKNTD